MSQVSSLLASLDEEMSSGDGKLSQFIDDLQMFSDHRSDEVVVGLDAKLKAADRDDQILDAQEKKEVFQKLLARLQHYPSAQKLFAYFLARINDVFEIHIRPYTKRGTLDQQTVDKIVEEMIVEPTLADMGNGFRHFTLTHAHIRGMIYWLADRCYVRWI